MFDTVRFGWKQNAGLKQGEENFLSASVVCLNSKSFGIECQWKREKKFFNAKTRRRKELF